MQGIFRVPCILLFITLLSNPYYYVMMVIVGLFNKGVYLNLFLLSYCICVSAQTRVFESLNLSGTLATFANEHTVKIGNGVVDVEKEQLIGVIIPIRTANDFYVALLSEDTKHIDLYRTPLNGPAEIANLDLSSCCEDWTWLGRWIRETIDEVNDVSFRMIQAYEYSSNAVASNHRKTLIYAYNYIDSFGDYVGVNDAAVLMTGENLSGSVASGFDKTLATIGVLLPVVSGSSILRVADNFLGKTQGGLKQSIDIVDSKIVLDSREANYDLDFVIMLNGELRVGKGHYYLSDMAEEVIAAGQMGVKNGKIEYLDNWSGHYQPSKTNLLETAKIFRENNLAADNLQLYLAPGSN